MTQHRKHSWLEAVTNTAVGFVLAVIAQFAITAALGVQITTGQNLIIVLVLTVVSILRGYVLRRLFNRYTSVEPVPEDTYIGTVTSFITANSPADISMVANEMRELPKTSG